MAFGDFTLTTEQIQARLDLVPQHATAISGLQTAIQAFLNTSQVQALINTALASYSTTDEMNTAISGAVTTALADYYTKTVIDTMMSNKVDKVSGKQLSTEDFTTALKTKLSDLPTNADLTTQISTAISTALASYSTTTQMNNAISNAVTAALTSYYTKSNVDSMVATINQALSAEILRAQAAEQANAANILFLNRALGKYDTVSEVTLSQGTAGKYVNVNGQEVSASGYGISNTLTLNPGDILLVPSAQAVPADVSVVARKAVKTYDKVIVYTYTTDEETGHYLTATADYDSSLVYSAIYEEDVFQYWIRNGVQYTELPRTHEVTESFYEPLVKQAVSAMPATGYYVYLCPTAMTVVISGLTATVNGGVALIIGLGIFKNIATNFVGAPGQAIIAQAVAYLLAEIEGMQGQLDNLGTTKAVSIDFAEMPKVCGYPLVVEGDGAPAIVPRFIGQRYHDATNKKAYEAFTITNSTADWVLLN